MGYDPRNCKSHYYGPYDAGVYHAKSMNGRYQQVDEAKVPSELHKVPRQHWGHYPSTWSDPNKPGDDS